jgi:hypothetical protein
MSVQFSSASSGNSGGMKVIRFFKIVGVLGGFVYLFRVLISVAVLASIFLALNGFLS